MSRNRSIKAVPVLALLASTIIFSCRKDKDGPSWDVDLLIPLVHSSLSINQILPDSILTVNPDQSLEILFEEPLYSFSSDTLFQIKDTALRNIYVSPLQSTVGPGGAIVPPTTQNVNSISGDAQLTQVIVRSGKMEFLVKSSVKEVTHLTYTLPKVYDPSGNPFSKTFIIPKGDLVNPGIYTASFDLSGYKVDLTGTNGTSVNTIVINYTAIVDPQATAPVLIDIGDSVIISNTFKGLVPQYARGYFGQTLTQAGPDSVGLTLFNHITGGTLDLEDVDVELAIENSVGADLRFTLQELKSVNNRTNTAVPLTHNLIGSPVNLNRAVDNGGQVTPSGYTISFKPSNSNIKPFLENLPGKLSYKLAFEMNPLGNVSGNNDFIYYDKLMKTQMKVRVPLSLIANDLTLADTTSFKLSESEDNVNHGTLKVYVENGFPFTAEIQLVSLNDQFLPLDTLVATPNVVPAPTLDGNGVCIGKEPGQLSIPLDADQMENLRTASHMLILVKFNTANQPNYVKVYDFYKMDVKLVGDFNYTAGKP